MTLEPVCVPQSAVVTRTARLETEACADRMAPAPIALIAWRPGKFSRMGALWRNSSNVAQEYAPAPTRTAPARVVARDVAATATRIASSRPASSTSASREGGLLGLSGQPWLERTGTKRGGAWMTGCQCQSPTHTVAGCRISQTEQPVEKLGPWSASERRSGRSVRSFVVRVSRFE